MKEFEIWTEGFSATGNQEKASFIGKAFGIDFNDACKNFKHENDIINEYTEEIIIHKGDKLKLDEHYSEPRIWGCRLFDNEADARKSFG